MHTQVLYYLFVGLSLVPPFAPVLDFDSMIVQCYFLGVVDCALSGRSPVISCPRPHVHIPWSDERSLLIAESSRASEQEIIEHHLAEADGKCTLAEVAQMCDVSMRGKSKEETLEFASRRNVTTGNV